MGCTKRGLATAVVLLLAAVTRIPAGGAGDKPATPRGSIAGKVTFNGKPLPGGTVGFHPEKGKAIVAALQPDGTYAVKELPVGKYRVTIETESAKPRVKDEAPPKEKEAPKGGAPKYVPIPPVYGRAQTTPLVVEVVEGKQNHDFSLGI